LGEDAEVASCIPAEEFDRFDEAPPVGTVFDLRIQAEKDSGCEHAHD
jgi:hypothetical protein